MRPTYAGRGAFTPGCEYAYVGNYADRNLQPHRIAGGPLMDTGVVLASPGQPASLRRPTR